MKRKNKDVGMSRRDMIAGGVLLVVAALFLIRPLIDKYSSKMYKSSLKKEHIDFGDMGPEIVAYNENIGE